MITSGSSPAPSAVAAAEPAIRVSREIRDPAWDRVLATVPDSHFEQTAGWGAVKARYGWQVVRFLAFAEGECRGGVQVLVRSLGRLGSVGYVARGPVVPDGAGAWEKLLVARVEEMARAERWLYVVFDYPYRTHDLAAGMAADGYFPHPPGIPPSGLLDATIMVDLRPTEEEILARMNSSVRRNVRRGLRSPLSFHLGGLADIDRFRELMAATCARRGCAPTPPQKEYFHHLWAEMGEKGWVRLFLVRHGDEVISAAFAFAISGTLRVWKVGWSGACAEHDPNHFMWWQIMRWGKANGFSTLDFVWVDTVDARRAARGELTPEGFRDGTTYFKLGFGGKLLFPPPVQSRFFHPLAIAAYRCGGGRLLASPAVQRALGKFWARKSGT